MAPLKNSHERLFGFGLIELTVAIGIVIVVIAISLPIYQFAVSGARQANCVAQMKQCGTILASYATEHRGWLPPIRRDFEPPLDGIYPVLFWTSLVGPYFEKTYNDQVGMSFLRCPERATLDLVKEPFNNYTYGLTYGKASGFDQMLNGRIVRSPVYSDSKIRPLRDLASTYILADAYGSQYPQTDWPHPSSYFGITNELNKIAFVHGGKGTGAAANFLLGDGSVRSLTVEQWKNNEGNIWGDSW